jgi:hypothetical protein
MVQHNIVITLQQYMLLPGIKDMLQASDRIVHALLLEPRHPWVTMGNCHQGGKAVVCELSLLQERVDGLLQHWHVVLLGHAAAVQQVVHVDQKPVPAIGMVYHAGDFSEAVVQFDAVLGRVDVVEHVPAAERDKQRFSLMTSAARGCYRD